MTRILLLHGFTQTSRSWEPIRAAVVASHDTAQDIEILAPDLAGHGSQSHRPLTMPAAAAEMAEWIEPCHLVGYSMGGRLALHLAVHLATTRPGTLRSLVLISCTAGIDDPAQRAERRAADRILAERIERIGVEAFIREWLRQPMFASLTEDSSDYRLDNTAMGLAESLRLAGTGAHEPLWDEVTRLEVPTLVITGGLDTKFTALGERLSASIDGARHVTIAESGHAVHLEQPDRVAGILRDWVTEIEASDPPPRAQPDSAAPTDTATPHSS